MVVVVNKLVLYFKVLMRFLLFFLRDKVKLKVVFVVGLVKLSCFVFIFGKVRVFWVIFCKINKI